MKGQSLRYEKVWLIALIDRMINFLCPDAIKLKSEGDRKRGHNLWSLEYDKYVIKCLQFKCNIFK